MSLKTAEEISKLRVIHFSSNEELPASVRGKIPDDVGQTIFRQAFNTHASAGKSEMHAYVKAYRAISDAGYVQNSDQMWNMDSGNGGPEGINLAVGIDSDPKYTRTGKSDVMYHGTHKDNVPSILESGLEPRIGENTTDHHDNNIHGNRIPKVHVFNNREDAEEYGTVLAIDVNHASMKDHKFQKDPEAENAFYTATNIPPEAIKIAKGGPGSGPQGHLSVFGNHTSKKVVVDNPEHPLHGKEGTIIRQIGNESGVDFKGEKLEWIKTEHLVTKSTPTSQMTHVNRPLGSDKEKDDPGTEELNSPAIQYFANTATIQNPNDSRDKRDEEKDDPGTQEVDPPEQDLAAVPNYLAMKVAKRISGQSDISLNKEGEALAAKLGVRIADKGGLDVLYSSPLERGKETAHEVVEACPHTVYAKPTPKLCPWRLAAFEGKKSSDVKDQIKFFIKHPDQVPPGNGADGQAGESFNASKSRQLGFWKTLREDFEADPTLKIGVVCHSRGLDLLKSWIDEGCPDDFDLDENDLVNPDECEHASMYRWHKDAIKEIDLDDDDPLKPGIYPILHSLTDDDNDEGNNQLKKQEIQKYFPPIEVHRAAKSAYDAGNSVLHITSVLAEQEALEEPRIREIQKHFETVESQSEPQSQRDAWGGPLAAKWAQRVIRKIEKDKLNSYPEWIAVDLDNTLAESLTSYGDGTKIGAPKKGKFFDMVKQAVTDGKPIRIWTARVAHDPTGRIANAIKAWCKENLGKALPVTHEKDPGMTQVWDDKAHNPEEINKADRSTSCMICFQLPREIGEQIKVEGGQDPSDMHVTLLYLGKDVPLEKVTTLEDIVSKFAKVYAPVTGTVSGPVRFHSTKHSDGKDVCVAYFSAVCIQEFRKALMKKVEAAGFPVKNNFTYTPHVTLKYIDEDAVLPVQRVAPVDVTFSKISVQYGDDVEDFDLCGTQIAKRELSGVIIEAQRISDDIMWAHVSDNAGNRYGVFFDPKGTPVTLGDTLFWDNTFSVCTLTSVLDASTHTDLPFYLVGVSDEENTFQHDQSIPYVGSDKNILDATSASNVRSGMLGSEPFYEVSTFTKVTGSKQGSWVTVNGQHILIGADGKPVSGNPRAFGRKVSAKVDRARKNAVLTGKHEQDIADHMEVKLAKALGVPRTKNNSAFDLRNDDIGIEVKTMVTGKNDKITMGKPALARKLAEISAEGIKGYTVVADMRGGRTAAKYYFSNRLGSLRLGTMTPITLKELKERINP